MFHWTITLGESGGCNSWTVMPKKNSCSNFVVTTTIFSSPIGCNPFDSWENNNLNNIGRYLKFRNRLKFYVPYFFSPFWTKDTQKNKCAFLQNKFASHGSKPGTTSKFVERKKIKIVETLLTYLPSFLLCYLLLSNLCSLSLISPLLTTKVIEPRACHQSYCNDYDNKTNP